MKIYLFLFFWAGIILCGSEPLDYFLTGTGEELSFFQQMKRPDGKKFPCGNTDLAIYCYEQTQLLQIPFKAWEIIVYYTKSGKFKNCDILLNYSPRKEDEERVMQTAAEMRKALIRHYGKPQKKDFYFPNGNLLKIDYFEATEKLNRVLLITKNYDADERFSFVSLKIEDRRLSYGNFSKYLRLHQKPEKLSIPRKKVLEIPFRLQLPDMGGCWYTTTSRTFAMMGMELSPLCVFVGIHGQEGEFKEVGKLLAKYSGKTDMRFYKSYQKMDLNILDFVEKYNKKAPSARVKKLQIKKDGKTMIWGDIFCQASPEIANKIRVANHGKLQKDYRLFRQTVIHSIANNIPMNWTIKLHNSRGRHRRSIIGYDLDKNIVYLSDSWMSAPKRAMPFYCAYLMTVWGQTFDYK